MPTIQRSQPVGARHELANQGTLDRVNELMRGKQDLVPLAIYMKEIAGKSRGTRGGAVDLNSHFEEFIVRKDGALQVQSLAELQEQLVSQCVNIELLGVASVGNPNQKVTAMVQGVNRDSPQSGYERPTVAEGPHMILAPYAIDNDGKLHLFRTIQYRTGEAVVDTPRGFADAQSLESGQQMYDVEGAGSRVEGNMKRIIGEEAGKKLLDIKRIVYLGAPRVNSSFVTSKSALFGVEVDYDSFTQSNKVVSEEEFQRRKEQLQHEGLMGIVLDMTIDQYANYKRDSEVSRDMAADVPAVREVIGKDGIFVKFGNKEQLTKAITKIATDKNMAMVLGRSGNKKLISTYTFSRIFPKYISIFN